MPNPRKNVGGLAAMVAAAGEYYDKTNITVADVTDPKFQEWLKELMGSVTDFSGASAYSAENLALFGYSVGDGGQLLESDLLTNMAGIQTALGRPAGDPLPQVRDLVRLPLLDLDGPETTAQEKNAALEFQKYLLSPEVQTTRRQVGPAAGRREVSITEGENLFTQWKGQGSRPWCRAQREWPRPAAMCCRRSCAGLI